MDKVKQFRVPILIGVCTFVVGLIAYAAVISPEGSHLTKLQSQQTTLQAQETALEVKIGTLKKEKAQLGTDCQQLTTDLTEIPGTPDVDTFFKQVTALAVAAGDPQIPTVNVTQSTGTPKAGVTSVTVGLTLSGTYGQMTAFLQGLDSFPRLFTVTTISVVGNIVTGGQAVSPSSAGYTLNLSGNIFYGTGEKNACAPSGATST